VDQVFANLVKSRTRDVQNGIPGPADTPFKSLATGVTAAGDKQYPNGSGIEDTILRSVPGGGGRLFDIPGAVPGNLPYFQQSLLAKIYNNMTIRSNVFAVWLTVGFFEIDANGKLGKEIGRAEGRHVRHRMFAVLDRSVYAKSVTSPSGTTHTIKKPVSPDFPGGSVVEVWPDSMTDIHQGSAVYFTHQGRSEKVTASQVIQPDKVVVSGAQNQYNPGTSITFRVQVPQFREPGHVPIVDDNGIPVTAWQTFTATLVSPIVNGKGVLQLSDPSLLAFVQPGNTSINVQGQTQWETSTVIQVLPANVQPDHFTCSLTKVYNVGDLVVTYYSVPVADPTPPTPNTTSALFFNTRDDLGQNNPIMFFSVIE
jgi:hypothetical protein